VYASWLSARAAGRAAAFAAPQPAAALPAMPADAAAWYQKRLSTEDGTTAPRIADYFSVGRKRPVSGPLADDARARVTALLAKVPAAVLNTVFSPGADFFAVGRLVENAGQRDEQPDVGSVLYRDRVCSATRLQGVSMLSAAALEAPAAPPPVAPPLVAPTATVRAAGSKRDAAHRTPPRPGAAARAAKE